MNVTCDKCHMPVEKELALAFPTSFRHQLCPPPRIEFFKEVLCDRHKRVTPGSAHCGTPPCQDRHYRIDGERSVSGLDIVSVTTVTKEIGDKFGQGAWWGMSVGVEGVSQLLTQTDDPWDTDDPEALLEGLKRHKLTTNHVRDQAADRGTDIHADAEHWAKTGELPDPDNGWRKAFRTFIKTEKVEAIDAEVLIGSRDDAYAGQSDLLCYRPKLDAVGLIDYKSKTRPPKGKPTAYEQNHLQLRGYMDGLEEMAHPTLPEFGAVVNLYPDGTYALIQGRATSEQWRSALGTYRCLTALRDAIKEAA